MIRAKDHFGLAAKIALECGAREKLKRGEAIEDTEEFGDALLGLTRAILHYNPDRGFKFSTFAYYCIKNEIIRAKKRKRLKTVNLGEYDGGVTGSLREIEDARELQEERDARHVTDTILNQFPEVGAKRINKKVLIDYYLKGKKLREIGDEIGVTKERVRQRREEGLTYIRNEILKTGA